MSGIEVRHPTFVHCKACNRSDLPRTTFSDGRGVEVGADTTANDHLRLYHSGEWFGVEWTDDGGVVLVPRPAEATA